MTNPSSSREHDGNAARPSSGRAGASQRRAPRDARVEDPASHADDDEPASIRSVVTAANGFRPLARITNPRELDASRGLRARMRVAVTREWLAGGVDLEVLAPRLLACDRCHGGGCDSCERSGALRAPADPESRLVRLTLPSEDTAPCVVRLVDPFAGSAIEQLLVRIELSETPSPRVRRVLYRDPLPTPGARFVPVLAIAVVLLFALAAFLFTR